MSVTGGVLGSVCTPSKTVNSTRSCGMYHIRKRGKRSWAVVFDLGADPASGKRRQKWISIKGSRRDAERLRAQIMHELAAGAYVPTVRMTLREFLELWLEKAIQPKNPKTLESYAGHMDHVC